MEKLSLLSWTWRGGDWSPGEREDLGESSATGEASGDGERLGSRFPWTPVPPAERFGYCSFPPWGFPGHPLLALELVSPAEPV